MPTERPKPDRGPYSTSIEANLYFCPGCRRVYSKAYTRGKRSGNEYYDHMPTYGLRREKCGSCRNAS